MKKISVYLSALCLTASLIIPASAAGPIEYNISGPGDPEYGKPTSFEVIHTADNGAMKNEDVSKNAALIPPGFGTASADTLNTGTPLTPNLAPGYQPTAGAVVNGSSAAVQPPDMSGSASVSGGSNGAVYVPGASTITTTTTPNITAATGYTEVTDDLYYSGGYLARLRIPSLNVNVKVFQGTSNKILAKGAGHFEDTSIWDGNCCIAGHNRGTNCYFDSIHTLKQGDRMTLTTKLGTRTYEVTSVSKVAETDRSGLAASGTNMLTLYTCVQNQSEYRWCVQAVQVV